MNFQNCWLFLLYRQHKLSLMEKKKFNGLEFKAVQKKEKKTKWGSVC